MKNRSLVSQSYIETICDGSFFINYYVLDDPDEKTMYGVEIEKIQNAETDCAVLPLVNSNYEKTLAFIRSLAKNFVTPLGLYDVAEDSITMETKAS
jgi:hypothetical protein